MVSWRNIALGQGGLGWDDYLEHGALAALGVAREITGSDRVNALGFCVGGTRSRARWPCSPRARSAAWRARRCSRPCSTSRSQRDIGVYISRETLAARYPALMAGELCAAARSPWRSRACAPTISSGIRRQQLPKGETPPPFDLLY